MSLEAADGEGCNDACCPLGGCSELWGFTVQQLHSVL